MDLQTVSIILAGIGIFIAAINSVYSSREAKRQRQMQLFMQIYSPVLLKDYAHDYVEWRDHYEWPGMDQYLQQRKTKTNLELHAKHDRLRRVLAYISVVINQGLIDVELVDDLIAFQIIAWWEKMEPMYQEMRTRSHDPSVGDDMEAAYTLLKQRKQQQISIAT